MARSCRADLAWRLQMSLISLEFRCRPATAQRDRVLNMILFMLSST